MHPNELRTRVALQVHELAESFNAALARAAISPGDYVPELTQPEGPSTSDGAHALQHVRLVPRAPGLPTLVAGHANRVEGTAELRTYEHLDAVHRERFGKPLDLDRAEYERFLEMATNVLASAKIETKLAPPPAPPDPSVAPPERERTRGMVVGFVLGAALASVAATLLTWLIAR